MAAIHTSGSLACFIFGGIILLPSLFILLLTPLDWHEFTGDGGVWVYGVNWQFHSTVVLTGLGCGLIALGWYIGVLSKN